MTEIQTLLEPKRKVSLPKKRRTYPQKWHFYYQASRTEKLMFFRIIKDAVDYLDIEAKYKGTGRPPANIKDIVKALCIKGYCGLSSWRIESELKLAQTFGIINKVYKRSALNNYLNNKYVVEILKELLKTIAEPLQEIEETVAIDATGMASSYGKKRWVEVRLTHRLRKDFAKLHIISGVKSNIIFSADVTEGTSSDSPHLKELLEELRFKPREFVADAGYISKDNVIAISDKGIKPFIMPRKNITGQRGGSASWRYLIRLWKENKEIFLMHYHARSNVESTFSMLKRKFGDYVRAKNIIGQTADILSKVVCLNAVILSEAMLEYGIRTRFQNDGFPYTQEQPYNEFVVK